MLRVNIITNCATMTRLKRILSSQEATMALNGHGDFRVAHTLEAIEAIYSASDGKCAICRKPPGGRKEKKLALDHCHKSMKLRGLLCTSCNTGLGAFHDDPDLMQRAIEYLKK